MASGMAGAGAGAGNTTADAAGATAQAQGGTSNGWGLLSMMKSTVAAVTPTGQPQEFGAATNGHTQPGQGQANLGPDMKLPDGKRLAYRMDYCVKETGNSYIAAVTSHTSYWANKDIAFFILTKMFPELEQVSIPANLN